MFTSFVFAGLFLLVIGWVRDEPVTFGGGLGFLLATGIFAAASL